MTGDRRSGWPYFPAQVVLLFAAIGMVVGAFLPWALILGHSLQASLLALSWTLWAAIMTLAAATVRWRVVVVVSAAAGGGTAAVLAVWQTSRILDRCPLSLDCLPGPGLGLLLAAGGAAAYQAVRLLLGPRGEEG